MKIPEKYKKHNPVPLIVVLLVAIFGSTYIIYSHAETCSGSSNGQCTGSTAFNTTSNLYVYPDSSGAMDLMWRPALNPSSNTTYQIFRNNALLTTVPSSTNTYTDNTVTAGQQYSYTVSQITGNNAATAADTSSVVTATSDTVEAGGSNVVTVPSSFRGQAIPDDCSADVSVPLTAFIQSVPSNSDVQFAASGCYDVEGSIFVAGKTDITIDGNNSQFKTTTSCTAAQPCAAGSPEQNDQSAFININAYHLYVSGWPRGRSQWNIINGSNIVMKNIHITGPDSSVVYDPNIEGQHGFQVNGTKNLLIEDTVVRYTYGNAVYIGDAYESPSQFPDYVTVTNNNFNEIGRQSIAMVDGQNVTISNNNIWNPARSIIDVEPDGNSANIQNLLFINNVVGGARLSFFANDGANGATFNNVVIGGNTVHGMVMSIIANPLGNVSLHPPARQNYIIVDNDEPDYTAGDPYGLMVFNGVDGLTIKGNYQKIDGNEPGPVVYVNHSKNIIIRHNIFPGAYSESTGYPHVLGGADFNTVNECNNLIVLSSLKVDSDCQ